MKRIALDLVITGAMVYWISTLTENPLVYIPVFVLIMWNYIDGRTRR